MRCACEGGLMAGRRYVPLPLRPKLVRCFHFPLPSPLSATHLYSILPLSLSHPLSPSGSLCFPLIHSLRRLALALILHLPDVVATMPTLFLFFVPRFFFLFVLHVSHVCVCALAADDFFPLLSFPASFVLYGFPERETFSTHIKNSTHTKTRSQLQIIYEQSL